MVSEDDAPAIVMPLSTVAVPPFARVAHEEESKGVPRAEAQRIGKRTAGKIWWEQHKNTY